MFYGTTWSIFVNVLYECEKNILLVEGVCRVVMYIWLVLWSSFVLIDFLILNASIHVCCRHVKVSDNGFIYFSLQFYDFCFM